MQPGRPYLFKHTTQTVGGSIARLRYRADVNTLRREDARELRLNEVGRCQVSLTRAIAFDAYRQNRTLGAFIVIDRVTQGTVGAGMIVLRRAGDEPGGSFWDTEPAGDLHEQRSRVSVEERARRLDQRAATLLLTGITGAGKSTIAYQLERRLFDSGRAVSVLDGENVRLGISRDLGFGRADRSENLRRAMEVARLLNRSGAVCICAFVAPERDARARARALMDGPFFEIHVTAPLEVCRARDADGRYARAEAGEIPDFPGVSMPYEAPDAPDLVLDTAELDVDTCVDRIVRLLEDAGVIPS